MKLTLTRKIVLASLATFAVALFAVILWEQVRDDFFSRFDNTVEMRSVEPVEFTLDALIDEKADSWLKSPEAYEYARTQVTEDVINELGKK